MKRRTKSHSGKEHDCYCRLLEWRDQPLGSAVAAKEQAVLAEFCSDLFGYQLVQLGEFGPPDGYLADCPIRTKHVFGVASAPIGPDTVARVENFRLPVAGDTVDAVILPHTLEFSTDPFQLLREVDRVLIPEGRLLLCGFNPWSFWGLWKLWPGQGGRMPWCGQFFSYPRLADWLSVLGFDVERTGVGMFQPPFAGDALLGRMPFLDRYGERFWPMLAGVYVVRAVKRVSTLMPVGPRWRRLRPFGAGAIEPTTRGVNRG
jgi:SAM-dependent methyltransferase